MLGQSMLPLDIVARYRIALYVYVMQRCAGAMQHTILFVTIYQCVFVVGIGALFSGTRGLFSLSRLRGTQGGRLHTTAHVWVPSRLRGASSGHSKSRNLARNRAIAFRGEKTEQDIGKPTCQLCCSAAVKTLYCELFCSTAVTTPHFVAATVHKQSHIKLVSPRLPVCRYCMSVLYVAKIP